MQSTNSIPAEQATANSEFLDLRLAALCDVLNPMVAIGTGSPASETAREMIIVAARN